MKKVDPALHEKNIIWGDKLISRAELRAYGNKIGSNWEVKPLKNDGRTHTVAVSASSPTPNDQYLSPLDPSDPYRLFNLNCGGGRHIGPKSGSF